MTFSNLWRTREKYSFNLPASFFSTLSKYLFSKAQQNFYSQTVTDPYSEPFRAILNNFAIFTGKYSCWSLFLITLRALGSATLLKRDSNTGEYSCEYCKIFKNTYFEGPLPTAASQEVLLWTIGRVTNSKPPNY